MASQKFDLTLGSDTQTLYNKDAVDKVVATKVDIRTPAIGNANYTTIEKAAATIAEHLYANSGALHNYFSMDVNGIDLIAENISTSTTNQLHVSTDDVKIYRPSGTTLGNTSVMTLMDVNALNKLTNIQTELSSLTYANLQALNLTTQTLYSVKTSTQLAFVYKYNSTTYFAFGVDLANPNANKPNIRTWIINNAGTVPMDKVDQTVGSETTGVSKIVHDGSQVQISQSRSDTGAGGSVNIEPSGTTMVSTNGTNGSILAVKPNDATLTYPLGSRVSNLTDSSVLVKSNLTGSTGIANGGTGSTTAFGAMDNLGIGMSYGVPYPNNYNVKVVNSRLCMYYLSPLSNAYPFSYYVGKKLLIVAKIPGLYGADSGGATCWGSNAGQAGDRWKWWKANDNIYLYTTISSSTWTTNDGPEQNWWWICAETGAIADKVGIITSFSFDSQPASFANPTTGTCTFPANVNATGQPFYMSVKAIGKLVSVEGMLEILSAVDPMDTLFTLPSGATYAHTKQFQFVVSTDTGSQFTAEHDGTGVCFLTSATGTIPSGVALYVRFMYIAD